MASHIYVANASMERKYFYNADGELLLVPQENAIRVFTECGLIEAGHGEVVLIPKGMKFKVDLPYGPARGYVCENYGSYFTLPERGPIGAGEISLGKPSRKGWWEWSDAKSAIEWLFWSGQVTSASRRGFERLYDLPERVLPPEILATPTPPEADAQRILVERAARALGVATEADLRDYYRLKPATARPALVVP